MAFPTFEIVKEGDRPVELVIRCDLTQPPSVSTSGKSRMVASTGGFSPVGGGTELKVNLNVTLPIR